jgi:hypothetical protein
MRGSRDRSALHDAGGGSFVPSTDRRPACRNPLRKRRNEGFALLFVIGCTLVVVGLVQATLGSARARLDLASGIEGRARAVAAADGALWHAVYGLRATGELPDLPSGVRVAAEGHVGRADVNGATEAELAQAARRAGLARPGAFAAAVLARREAFAAAGIPWRLEARPFATERDLLALAAPDERGAVAGAFTVHPADDDEAVHTLTALARTPGGAEARREAVVAIGEGVRVLSWR